MIKITVLPGDGIGPDIVGATTRILDELDCGLEFEYALAGSDALGKGLDLVPEETLSMIEKKSGSSQGNDYNADWRRI